MKSFEYGDQEISHKEIMFAVPSMVVGLGILTLPQRIAGSTNASDGWASILGAGIIILFFVWITAKLAAQFPKMTFVEYAARLISKPAAITITLLFSLYLLMFTSNIVRSVANVAKDYLFERTPLEVLMLVFFSRRHLWSSRIESRSFAAQSDVFSCCSHRSHSHLAVQFETF